MLAHSTIIAANIAERKTQNVEAGTRNPIERAQYMGWEDATLGESMRGSLYYIIDSLLWWVYVGEYNHTRHELGEDIGGCEFQVLPAWQREEWVGE